MPPATSWRTTATTHGRFRPISGIETSSTRCGTRNWPRTGSTTSGAEGGAMTETSDNVIPLPSSATPEPQPRRKKDRRAAARQAKLRSKNKSDRDASRSVSAPPAVVVDAPPIVPNAAIVTRHAPITHRVTHHGADVAAYIAAIALAV